MVFGLKESDSEELYGRVLRLFAELGKKPQFEEGRIGKLKPGTVRPEDLLMSSFVTGQLLLIF